MNINSDREIRTSTPVETVEHLPERQAARVETAGNFGVDASLCETPARAVPETGRRSDGRPIGRPFQRGQTGNPKGRPKGIKAAVQRKVGESGEKMVAAVYAIATDLSNGARTRMQAWEWLADRAFGKPQSNVALEGTIDTTVRSVVFGGRFRADGDLQADRVETRPVPRSVDRSAMRTVETDDDSDILVAAARRPAGALPAPSTAVSEPEPEDPAESAWTAVEP